MSRRGRVSKLHGFVQAGAMLERLCTKVVATPSHCHAIGVDGTWYYLATPTETGELPAAITWSPRPGTDADAVVDVFTALRAYVMAPDTMRIPAANTLYSEISATYFRLGLFETPPGVRVYE